MSSWDDAKEPVYAKWKARWLDTHPAEVGETTWTYLFTGGKEIRARLFYELWTYLCPSVRPNLELAFALECIHVSSLVLDDTPWMDHAMTRRGRPTLHTVYSPKKALLIVHDVMRMMVEIWIAERPSFLSHETWFSHLQRILERLSIGQWYDLAKRGTLVELASLKTGVLFEGVTETVAYCLLLNIDAWSTWGNRLGILFQWADDWEDRDEDTVQQNRNAFLESYDDTLDNYERLWVHLCGQIGAGWFDRPFGAWMMTYFTKQTDDSFPLFRQGMTTIATVTTTTTVTVTTTSFVYRETPGIRVAPIAVSLIAMDGLGMIRRILALLMGIVRKNPLDVFLQTNLWEIPEEKWDSLPECMERLHAMDVSRS